MRGITAGLDWRREKFEARAILKAIAFVLNLRESEASQYVLFERRYVLK